MPRSPVIDIQPLGFPWVTLDPFIFCVHHEDHYPAGNDRLGPADSMEGRALGNDFAGHKGYRMYHGREVPGFPAHPHRGFETVTIARKGYVDHSDSLGAAARFGQGDVQWMTAGRGVQHSEMFPLLDQEAANPFEIFQIWLNLPAREKHADPHFALFWADEISTLRLRDDRGGHTEIQLVAGRLAGESAPTPPPASWAADPANDVNIWTIAMESGAQWTTPEGSPMSHRMLYFYAGHSVEIGNNEVSAGHAIQLEGEREVPINNLGPEKAYFLMLQGVPIRERVVKYGPFVMNADDEIEQAYQEFRHTQFGGWPWPSSDHVHPREAGRFARFANGAVVRKELT